MYCSKCGNKLVASAAFCSACGASADTARGSGTTSSGQEASRGSKLTLKPLHYPFTAAIMLAFIGWLAGKSWGREMAGIIGMAFIFGLAVAVIEISVKYFRRK